MTHPAYIGIDPDSLSGTICTLSPQGGKPTTRRFDVTADGLQQCVSYLRSIPDPVIGIEGKAGYATAFERAFAQAGIPYYSLPAFRVDSVRKGLLGENKNNAHDAAAVAHAVRNLSAAQSLEIYRGHFDEDQRGLRILTRTRQRLMGQQTALKNALRIGVYDASPELAMFFADQHPSDEGYSYCLAVIRLFKNNPDVLSWKQSSDEELLLLMEAKRHKVTLENIANLRKFLDKIAPITKASACALQVTAAMIIALHESISKIEKRIEASTKDHPLVIQIDATRGVGLMTAATIVAEIQDKTFRSDDALASYSGLCRREHKTGNNDREKQRRQFNRFLKNAFMQAAAGMKMQFGDPVIRSYYKSLLRRGMKKIEAQKRIARGFARKVYALVKKGQNVMTE